MATENDENMGCSVKWDGGIVYAARQVVSKEKAVVFMAEALADEKEIHETLTKIIRGEPIGSVEDAPKYKDVISACKLLQDKFTDEKKMLLGSGGGRSIILQLQQQQQDGGPDEIGAGLIRPTHQIAAPKESAELTTLTASIKNIGKAANNIAGITAGLPDDDDDESITDLITSDSVSDDDEEEESDLY